MSKHISRPSGMLKHVVTLRHEPIPDEKIGMIKAAFMAGEHRMEIARDLGLSYYSVCNLVMSRAPQWREEERLKRLVADERRIIVTRTVVEGAQIRKVRHSLPRISMHVAALEARA